MDRTHMGFPKKKRAMQRDKHGRDVPENPALDTPMKRFFEHIDKGKLEMFLATKDEKYLTFLTELHNPINAKVSSLVTARKCGVTLHELQTIYNDGCKQLAMRWWVCLQRR